MRATFSTRTLQEFGFARGDYQERADDGLELLDCRITNAVRCVPPENKPLPVEINTCRDFLVSDAQGNDQAACRRDVRPRRA